MAHVPNIITVGLLHSYCSSNSYISYVFPGHIHPHIWIRWVSLETNGDQLYEAHNRPRACLRQRSQAIGSSLQSTPLDANSISNSRISTGCQYTPQELLWPQVVLYSSTTSSYYGDVLIEVHQFPQPQCMLSILL